MQYIHEPCPDNDFLETHALLLIDSFFLLTGKTLITQATSTVATAKALYEAPFCVVSHNTDDDPIFNYANKAALNVFEMTWQEFTQLPSRLSAEQKTQEERDLLLQRVTNHGFIDDYTGVRISSTGKRFFVNNATVWNLINKSNHYCGQAAVLYDWSPTSEL